MNLDSSSVSDVEIIHRVVEGDVNGFEILLKRYKAHILKVVNRHVPSSELEDISQEVFIRAYKSLPTFKARGSFKQWLSAIALRTCYDFWRKRYRSREKPVSTLSENHQDWLDRVMANQSNEAFNDQRSQKEAKEVLAWALGKLSAEDRMIIEMVYLEGLSLKETSQLLGWSIANVKVRSYRSRKKLQKLLET